MTRAEAIADLREVIQEDDRPDGLNYQLDADWWYERVALLLEEEEAPSA